MVPFVTRFRKTSFEGYVLIFVPLKPQERSKGPFLPVHNIRHITTTVMMTAGSTRGYAVYRVFFSPRSSIIHSTYTGVGHIAI